MANFRFYRNTSLARRVLLICLALLVIPLILFSLLLADKEKDLQKRDHDIQLGLIGQSVSELAREWVQLQESNLRLITYLLKEQGDPSALLHEFAEKSTLFVIDQGAFQASNNPELIGEEVSFTQEKIQVAPLLPDQAPSLILLSDSVGIAVDASTWLNALSHREENAAAFSLEIVDKQGKTLARNTLEKQPSEVKRSFPMLETSLQFRVSLSKEAIPSIHILNSLLHLLFLLLFVGGGCALWLTQRMARPLKQLHQVMDKVEQGDMTARYAPDLLGFEINQIGGHFNQTLEALLEQRLAKELLAKELAIGHEIQKSLFPRTIPKAPGLEVAAGFLPAREVAGDFYDLYFKTDDQLLIAIADASDKGISACLYSLLLRSLLRSQVQAQKNLSDALYEANALFCKDTGETGNFATAWVGLYDLKTQRLTYCNAGHPPALLLHPDGRVSELGKGMGALGVIELAVKPPIETLQLSKGDLLFLITDGITEAKDAEGEFFGKKALYAFLHSAQNKTPQETVDLLLQEIQRFSRGAERSDDLTILSMKID